MTRILATALTALTLGGTAALAGTDGHHLEFPMTPEQFMQIVPDASLAVFETIDTTRDGMVSEHEFELAVDAGIIEDPRS